MDKFTICLNFQPCMCVKPSHPFSHTTVPGVQSCVVTWAPFERHGVWVCLGPCGLLKGAKRRCCPHMSFRSFSSHLFFRHPRPPYPHFAHKELLVYPQVLVLYPFVYASWRSRNIVVGFFSPQRQKIVRVIGPTKLWNLSIGSTFIFGQEWRTTRTTWYTREIIS